MVLRGARVDARPVELRRQLLLVLRLLVRLELVEAGQVAPAERVRQALQPRRSALLACIMFWADRAQQDVIARHRHLDLRNSIQGPMG